MCQSRKLGKCSLWWTPTGPHTEHLTPINSLLTRSPHIASTISRLLVSDIKSILRLPLTCADSFAVLAQDAALWCTLYIQNEYIQHPYAFNPSWTITEFPELVRVLNDPTYTDHSRKFGYGRPKRSVWLRCAMMMAMRLRTNVCYLHNHINDNNRSGVGYLCKGLLLDKADETTVLKVFDDGQWDSDVVLVDILDHHIPLEHSIVYTRHGEKDWSYKDDLAKFIDHPENPPYPILHKKVKFGDWIVANDWRGDGKYYVTHASAVSGAEDKATDAVISAPGGYSEYCAAPVEFAPPTFPFLYHLHSSANM